MRSPLRPRSRACGRRRIRLVRSEQDRIRLIAQALLRHQRLTGEQIFEMLPRQSG